MLFSESLSFSFFGPLQDSIATSEALRRLENSDLADMRKELGLLMHQIEIEVSTTLDKTAAGDSLLPTPRSSRFWSAWNRGVWAWAWTER